MMKNVLKDQEGAVLVLVLIVLVASIIMGVMIIRSSIQESRMVGNERRYITNFANIESAVNFVLVQNTASLAAVATTIGNSFTSTPAAIPSGTSVTVTLTAIKKPPVGKGYDPTFKSRYYTFTASDNDDSQSITVGAYKVFPPTGAQ
jgi:Tfp pilus assembly protein PilX